MIVERFRRRVPLRARALIALALLPLLTLVAFSIGLYEASLNATESFSHGVHECGRNWWACVKRAAPELLKLVLRGKGQIP